MARRRNQDAREHVVAFPVPTARQDTVQVAVVVVNHDSAAATRRCLAALWGDEPDVPAVVVDNSTDPAQASTLAAALGPRARVFAVVNRGFGAGCNAGIECALAAWPALAAVLLLNPDTVPEPGALRALRATLSRHPDAGAVGARLVSLDGQRTLFARGRIRRCTLTKSHVGADAHTTEYRSEFLTGACLLLAADLLRVGLRFDEGYFLYVEDMDLSCAIVARGRTLWINRDAVVRHADGGTQREPAVAGNLRARQLRWMTAGKVRFARKWLRPWQRACFYTVAVLVKPVAGVLALRSMRFLRPYFAGLCDGWRQHPPTPSSLEARHAEPEVRRVAEPQFERGDGEDKSLHVHEGRACVASGNLDRHVDG
jgi:GT2 family glycosyltransferase